MGMETSTPRAGSQLAPTVARHSAPYGAEPLQVSSRDELAEMAAASQGNFEGKFESLDLAELAKKQPWWRKLFGQESGPSAEKYSVATQLLIGGVTGWCTGFIFQKVGRLAATALGGGFFLLQLANHTGYIKVDWKRVERDMKKAKEQLKVRKGSQTPAEVKSKADEVVSFVKKNVLVTGGFFGGFLLGMAS
ncbi:FUN14 domain-containing protein 2 [Phocoena sinus]|nr:FUN14 domain-containing protein 2 [Phocoena sinus]